MLLGKRAIWSKRKRRWFFFRFLTYFPMCEVRNTGCRCRCVPNGYKRTAKILHMHELGSFDGKLRNSQTWTRLINRGGNVRRNAISSKEMYHMFKLQQQNDFSCVYLPLSIMDLSDPRPMLNTASPSTKEDNSDWMIFSMDPHLIPWMFLCHTPRSELIVDRKDH